MHVKLHSYERSGEQACNSFPHLHTAIAHSGLWVRHLFRLRRRRRQARRRPQALVHLRTGRRCAPRLMLQQMPCENPCCLQTKRSAPGNTHWHADLRIRMRACAL